MENIRAEHSIPPPTISNVGINVETNANVL
jgi:hypothetical protein